MPMTIKHKDDWGGSDTIEVDLSENVVDGGRRRQKAHGLKNFEDFLDCDETVVIDVEYAEHCTQLYPPQHNT